MGGPISETERLLLDRKVRHGGHEVLRWCESNTIVYQDAGGRRRFDKKKSHEKIDLAVAMVMGVWHAVSLDEVGESFYDTNSVEVAG